MSVEKRKLLISLFFPVLFLLTIWLVKLIEVIFQIDLGFLGVSPRKLTGLVGIATSPLIHADFNHLISNSIPVFLLSWGIFYFYSEISFQVFFLVYFLHGIWLWFGGRDSIHIGASGLIYGFSAFLFFSGIIRKYTPMMAISGVVLFLYGGIIWGIFPTEPHVSWEAHLMGFVAGTFLAIYYRKSGPQRQPFEWELESNNSENESTKDDDQDYTIIHHTGGENEVNYFYKETE
jgi:membrane associated rhomboid family serine protease